MIGGLGKKRMSGNHPTTALLRSDRILMSVPETREDLFSLKVFAKNEKEWEILKKTLTIYSDDFGMGFRIEKFAMLKINSGKRQNDGKIWTNKSR